MEQELPMSNIRVVLAATPREARESMMTAWGSMMTAWESMMTAWESMMTA